MQNSDQLGQLTIKKVPDSLRNAFALAARTRSMEMGQYFVRMMTAVEQLKIRGILNEDLELQTPSIIDIGKAVPAIPEPVNLEAHQDAQEAQDAPSRNRMEIAALIEIMNAVSKLSTATGVAPSQQLVKHQYALVDQHMREVRGLAPLKPRQPPKPKDQPIELVGRPVPSKAKLKLASDGDTFDAAS